MSIVTSNLFNLFDSKSDEEMINGDFNVILAVLDYNIYADGWNQVKMFNTLSLKSIYFLETFKFITDYDKPSKRGFTLRRQDEREVFKSLNAHSYKIYLELFDIFVKEKELAIKPCQ